MVCAACAETAALAVLVGATFLKESSKMKRTKIKIAMTMTLLVITVALVPMSTALGSQARQSFAFNADNISGFPTGAARLTGGGAYDLGSGFLHTGGGFRCLEDVNQGPLSGCLAGEGIRWDSGPG